MYKFSWDEFIDYGIAVLDVLSPDVQNTFWIYFVTVGCVRHRCCAAREIFFALATS